MARVQCRTPCRKLKLSLHWKRMTPRQIRRSSMDLGCLGSLTTLTYLDLRTPFNPSLACISGLRQLQHLCLHIADHVDNLAYVPVVGTQTQLTCIQLSVDTVKGWGNLQQVSVLSWRPIAPFIPFFGNYTGPTHSRQQRLRSVIHF